MLGNSQFNISETIDVASQADLVAYHREFESLLRLIDASVSIVFDEISRMTEEEYLRIYYLYSNVKYALLGIPQDRLKADFIGEYPCIDVLYTMHNFIIDIIKSSLNRMVKHQSLTILLMEIASAKNAAIYANEMLEFARGIRQAHNLANALKQANKEG